MSLSNVHMNGKPVKPANKKEVVPTTSAPVTETESNVSPSKPKDKVFKGK